MCVLIEIHQSRFKSYLILYLLYIAGEAERYILRAPEGIAQAIIP